MFGILGFYGIPPEPIEAIEFLYLNTRSTVPDCETESYTILTGVLQGDVLAPFLFIIATCIDYIVDTSYRHPSLYHRR